MKLKNTLLLLFFLLAGIVFGGMLASVSAKVGFLNWLAYTGTIGFSPGSPFVLDLSVLSLTFGFSMSVSVAQVLTIALSLLLYGRLKRILH